MRWLAVLLTGILALMLCGCLQTRSHITIHSNGWADVEYTVGFNRDALQKLQAKYAPTKPLPAPGEIARQLAAGIKQEVRGKNIAVAPFQTGNIEGVKLHKLVTKLGEIQPILGAMQQAAAQKLLVEPPTGNFGLVVKKGFFADDYTLSMKLGSDVKNLKVAGMMAEMARDYDAKFSITFPVKPRKSNATTTEDGGRTLVWETNPVQATTLKAEDIVPRWRHIVGTGLALVLLIAGMLVAVLRKRRRAARARDYQPAALA